MIHKLVKPEQLQVYGLSKSWITAVSRGLEHAFSLGVLGEYFRVNPPYWLTV